MACGCYVRQIWYAVIGIVHVYYVYPSLKNRCSANSSLDVDSLPANNLPVIAI